MKKILIILLSIWILAMPMVSLAAIAFDNSTNGGQSDPATEHTFDHAVTGSNVFLVVHVVGHTASDVVTGVTYDGVSMTLVSSSKDNTDRFTYLFILEAPATGTNEVKISSSASVLLKGDASSYTGAAQTGQPDAESTGGQGSGTSYSQSVTTVADNSWLVLITYHNAGGASAGTGTVVRESSAGDDISDSDSAQTPAGSHSLNLTLSVSTALDGHMISFSPAAEADTGFTTVNIISWMWDKIQTLVDVIQKIAYAK